MTRFARAKGSKSSNERAPEESTPWEVMKEQLMQSKKEKDEAGKRREAENQRIANYESFLKDQRVSKRKATWCDFPEEQPKKRLLPLKRSVGSQGQVTTKNNESTVQIKSTQTDSEHDMSKKNNKKKKQKNLSITGATQVPPNQPTIEPTELKEDNPQMGKKHKKKNKKKNRPKGTENNSQEDCAHEPNIQDHQLSSNENNQTNNVGRDKKKKKSKKKNLSLTGATHMLPDQPTMEATELKEDIPQMTKKQKKKNIKKNKHNGTEKKSQEACAPESNVQDNNKISSNISNENNQSNSIGGDKKKKKGKGKPNRRKVINDNSFQLIINGKQVELVRFDGFPIMKKDAERLTELKQSMIQKGIPKSEVQRTMKLERRRAEKALARVKREVCYNCRKGGHNLSDCPELKSKIPGVDAADGVCFKCGSTEHRQFECKVQRDKEFRFATCFICREAGHIARQCPDNPKGLYPNGGSCKLCGDVTHLRKDCPTTQGQREETSLKLDTLESVDNIEDIGQTVKASSSVDSGKKAPKKIKF